MNAGPFSTNLGWYAPGPTGLGSYEYDNGAFGNLNAGAVDYFSNNKN